ncbi:hypothetical protein [Halosimplex marinum]
MTARTPHSPDERDPTAGRGVGSAAARESDPLAACPAPRTAGPHREVAP